MSSPFERMQELATTGVPFAVATVIRTQGSTPQVVGAKLILTGDASERPFGTLGGGCVEADAIDAARKVLAGEPAAVREHQLTEELAWDTGLVCGGTMWILAEAGSGPGWPPAVDGIDAIQAAADAARGGPPVAFVSAFRRTGRTLRLDARVLVLAGGRMLGTLGSAARDERARDVAIEQMRHGTARLVPLDDAQELLVEPVTSRPQLVIAGGGHVSRAIARQARLLDFDVAVIEDRPAFADPERFDGASVLGGELIPNIASFPYIGAVVSRRRDARAQARRGVRRRRRADARALHRAARQPAQDDPDRRHAARAGRRRVAHRGDSRARRPRPRRPDAGRDRAVRPRRDHPAALSGNRSTAARPVGVRQARYR